MKKWYLVCESRGDEFEEDLNAKTKEDAYRIGLSVWEAISRYDQKQCKYAYVCSCEGDEYDCETEADHMTIK